VNFSEFPLVSITTSTFHFNISCKKKFFGLNYLKFSINKHYEIFIIVIVIVYSVATHSLYIFFTCNASTSGM